MQDWFPERVPFQTHRLKVSDLHTLYVEECGNPSGIPVLWCHGGPGSGIAPTHGRQFDPALYHIILFDQRGSGQSTPFAETRENTTQDLIADIEKIRELLKIESWIVAGRSWGTTLALLYAEQYPEKVRGLFLAAIFLCEKKSSEWIFQEGASAIYPEAWEAFSALVPSEKRTDIFAAYREMMGDSDAAIAEKAARAWMIWEATTSSVLSDPAAVASFTSPTVMLPMARLECHYLGKGGFIQEGQILSDASKIKDIPTVIVHGRYDMNCRFSEAWRLHKALPRSTLIDVPLGGHLANTPESIDAQMRAVQLLETFIK